MSKTVSRRAGLILTGLILAAPVLTGTAEAAQPAKPAPPQGMTVSPAYQQLSVEPGESSRQVSFTVTNNLAKVQTIDLSVADFGQLTNSGDLFFIGSHPTELQQRYGLAKWVRLDRTEVSVMPKHSVAVTAQILAQPDMAPGGHYGALMLSPVGLQADSGKVAVQPIASSLMFVTRVGGDIHKLGLNGISFSHSIISLPDSVALNFYNDGNTQVVPRGVVTLTAPDGQVVSRSVINQDSNIILPQVSRVFSVGLNSLGHAVVPGNYRLSVSFRFDGENQFRTYQVSFFYLPPTVWLVPAAVGLLIFTGFWRNKNYRFEKPGKKSRL